MMELNVSSGTDDSTKLNAETCEDSPSILDNEKIAEDVVEIYVKETKKVGLKDDFKKLVLLVYFYFLQGIPLGLTASVPYLLSARGVSYSDQGTFSFAFWPFASKIIWAPIVDSIYIKKIGRRKTWLVPVQFLMALFMFTLPDKVQALIDNGQYKSDIILLTIVFAVFNTLAATQDIAVDGLAISILSRENVSWQATCSYLGQALGIFLGNIFFIVVESKKFSNLYIRPLFNLPSQDHGIITLKMFMYTFGGFYTLTTIILFALVNEKKLGAHDKEETPIVKKHLSLLPTYKIIWKMMCLGSIRKLMLIFLTVKIGWALDSAIFLKMIEYGVPKSKLGLLYIPLIPLSICWSLLISKKTNSSQSLIYYSRCIPVKLLITFLICVFVYFVPTFKNAQGEYEVYFFFICLIVFGFTTLADTTLSMSRNAFFARVSDESVGGTYMTFLNTLSNLGGMYPGTLALFLINWFSQKKCSFDTSLIESNMTISSTSATIEMNNCRTTSQSTDCKNNGGVCITLLDAFYYLAVTFYLTGLTLWLLFYRKMTRILNNTSKYEWKLVNK